MLGFIAQAEPDVPQAGDELEEARWFDAGEVRAGLAADWAHASAEGEGIVLSAPISIARWLVERWLAEHSGAEHASAEHARGAEPVS
jgi:NAD+ diphosphatase